MEINTTDIPVGVVGLGLMGCSITTCFAMAGHPVVAIAPVSDDLKHAESGETASILPQAALRTNDFILAANAVSANLGISLLPDYYYSDASGAAINGLRAVLPEWKARQRPVYLLYRDREVMPARLRAFVDFVLAWVPEALPVHIPGN